MKTVTLYYQGTPIVHKPISNRQIQIGTESDNDLIVAASGIRDCRITLELDQHGKWRTKLEGAGLPHVGQNAELSGGNRIELGEYAIGFTTLASDTTPRPANTMGMVGQTPVMQQLRQRIRQLGPLGGAVTIEGESGTGKELAARALHENSRRSMGPFVAVNCGGITDTMAEDIFFGHEKGAFTGASQHHKGVFERASGGTLFLDEIGELPLCHQASLLRVLDTRTVSRIGSEQCIQVDFRLITATNRKLTEMVDAGRFRLDLYHRISTLQLQPPPLRHRKPDIPILADHFLKDMQNDVGPKRLSADAVERLTAHPWPGNCRELRNALYKSAAFCSRATLYAEDLELSQPERTQRVRDVDDDTIVQELCRLDGNVSAVAKSLGLPRTSLRNRLRAMKTGALLTE
ncbi:MAG: sigma-54-dependent Fis family transcriptional regulator [Deltaproteobacteria bacterium]|nr:sigma-54-dependent Fis family transcriptional regulator [Deltaproteobacteria bacterium]